MKNRLFALLVVAFAWCSMGAMAAEKAVVELEGPHKVVKEVTDEIMGVINRDKAKLKENPAEYYAAVRAKLEPVVYFDFIAKNVMASYWKSASTEQKKQFTETFTQSMVETLGKGMANFSDLKINTLPPQGEIASQRKVEVEQEVRGADGTNRVSYTMAQVKPGDWKLINVVLNGVNLGKSFRDQFQQAMKQSDNQIDVVIKNWAQQG